MARSVSFPHRDRVTPPLEEISHIWAYLRQVDRDYIKTFVGDIPMLAICRPPAALWNLTSTSPDLFWYRAYSATQAPPPAHDPTCMAMLEGNVTTLQNTVDLMAANMAEMMVLLRGPNRSSSSSTLPLASGPTVDPTPWVPSTHALEGDIAAAPAPAIIPVPAPHPKHTNRLTSAHDDSRAGSDYVCTTSRLPLKVKMPEFEKYDGTKYPRHHLRHYHTKMLQYWDYEQFGVATFQESLSGSALNWFMSLQAEDIPSWVELAKKFVEQYQYNIKTPRSFLELSTMEMAEDQKFEKYATDWRSEAVKHFPPICKAQQIQMFHGTLKGAYYSHLMGHKSPISEMIMAGKQVDLGIKLGRQLLAGNIIRPTVPGSSFTPANQDQSLHCEYHSDAPSHTTDNCWKLREEVQKLINDEKISFNATKPPNVQANTLPDHGSSSGPTINMISDCIMREDESQQEGPAPFIILYVPAEATVGFTRSSATPAPFIMEVPARELYQDNKVPWTYEGSVGNLEQQFSVMGVTRSGLVYMNLEIAGKAQVPKETALDRIEETVSSIFSNAISFSDDELPSKGWAHSRALHIVCKCNNFVIGRVMIDNSSALNVCPVSTLKQMNVDLNRVRSSKTAVRAFDSSRREVNEEIDLLIDVGPCSFNVTFQVLDILNAFSLLLGRPRIHSAEAVPSSLHQRIKFITDCRLITVKGEEDYTIYKETVVPYISIGDDENLPFHSFETISVIRDYEEVHPSRADRMVGKVLLRHNYVPDTELGAQGQGINCPIKIKEYKNRRGLGFRPSCHEIIEARRGKHLHHLVAHYGKINRGIPVLPLSHFFPVLLHVSGGTLDGPFSALEDEPIDLSAICAVTKETPLGVHIRLAQENEELNNWTSVPRYSTVIADVLHSNPNLRHVDSNSSEEHLEESRPIYFGEGRDEDGRVPEIEESLRRLENRQFTSVEPTKEFNMGTEEEPHILKIGTGLNPIQRGRMIEFLTEYQEVLAWSYADMPGLDSLIVKHFLPLDTERFPPKRQHLRRQRASLLLRIKEEVIKQINAGFLEVYNYSEWVANNVPVEKKDGKVRVCVDYWDLNKASPKDNFPLPHIDVLVDNTAHHTLFSFMDGFFGYNQIRMAEEDKIKTMFVTMWGIFCYRKYKLRLNPAKCTFSAKLGKLLGFVVSERGIEVDPDKVKAIRELPAPSTVRELRGFLGRLNYIARFIANLTDKCQPLFRLLRKNASIKWDEECQKAFNTIKAYLVQPPVLVPPTPDRPLILYLTVRRQSLGCMLGQKDESTHAEHAIYYLSKKFTKGESNYPEIEKMCCALLTEYDIEYVPRTSVKGQAIADHLAEFPIEDDTPINSDFLDEGILQMDSEENKFAWKMYFDGAVNFTGSGIGAVLIPPNERYYPIAAKVDFPCTNNVAEYEACILGLQAAINFK
ncbi:hypothetical protein CRG98_006616, partial [Punica granatum]